MQKIKSAVLGRLENPVWMAKVNGWLTVFWAIAAIPICIYLNSSVPLLVFISVYAIVTGHLSTWQSAKVEINDSLTPGDESKIKKIIGKD